MPTRRHRLWELFVVTTRLGLTSFGGPIAHLGYFHEEYVRRRRWLDEATYADLVALCQFLPGPASSQVGIAIGIQRAGLLGGVVSWLGFTWPSALLMILFAAGLHRFRVTDAPWLHGLMLAAVAVIGQAVWSMANQLARGRRRAAIAVIAALLVLLVPAPWMQVAVIAAAALAGRWWLRVAGGAVRGAGGGTGEARAAISDGAGPGMARSDAVTATAAVRTTGGNVGAHVPLRRRTAVWLLALFFVLLAGLPLLRMVIAAATAPAGPPNTIGVAGPSTGAAGAGSTLALWDVLYRTGSLVFGGGHVALPLLQMEMVPRGWVPMDAFLAGYGAAQAVPGPLFTFSAYLGYVARAGPGGVAGAVLALVAIFLPGFLLVAGCLPFWATLRSRPSWRSALAGVNAAVVGILLAALYNPVWTSTVHAPVDFPVALTAFTLLTVWRVPPWAVVLLCATAGEALAWL